MPKEKNIEPQMRKQDDIIIITDPVKAARTTPDVYAGQIGNNGFINMVREIVQNSLDEIIKGNSIDKNVIVSYDANTHIVIVEDFGQGIPIDMLVDVFSNMHSSSNYYKSAGCGLYSSGKNGMGAKVTNFFSRFFTIESYRLDGSAGKAEFIEGRISKKGLQKLKPIKGKHGLITSFAPTDMVGEITVTTDEIANLLYEQCHYFPIGTRITYNSIDTNNVAKQVVFENKRGLIELLEKVCIKPLIAPIGFAYDDGTHAIECLFTYDIGDMGEPLLMGVANMCHTTSYGSTHIDGFDDALVKYFRDYMNKIYLAGSKKKLQVTAADIRTGLRGIVSVKSIYPLYTGQSKEVFSEKEMFGFASEQTMKAITEWAKMNPTDLQKLGKYFKDVCEIRSSIDDQKVKLQKNYTASVITGLPAKYKKPNGKLKELWIVEGDSALGGMENNRVKEYQGLFPVRGKIPNALVKSPKAFFENEEMAGLFKILGYNGYSRVFDPEKFKPEKVVISADADADGLHITCLVLMAFLKYLPFAVEQGKLYAATPPLFGLNLGNNKMKFFAGNLDIIEYLQNLFCKSNTIANIKTKKPLSKQDILKFLYNNIDYDVYVKHVSSIFAIDPQFLEFLLYNRNLKYSDFKKTVEKAYKYTTVSQQNGTIMIHGLVGSLYQTVFFNDMLINNCKNIIDMMDSNNDKYYLFNGEPASIYTIINSFKDTWPTGLTRYKGEGEMTGKLLGESTVIPGNGRTLKQFTVTEIHKELKRIAELQSRKEEFTKNLKIRKEDIE